MLIGLAIGDALGNTSEAVYPGDRQRRFGRIESYLANHYAGGRAVGLPSGDTQLAAWTIEYLLEHGGLVSDQLSWTFATCRIFGIGKATRAFQAHRRAGASWQAPGQRSAGNGVLMRIAPAVAWCDLLMRLLASEVPDGPAWWLDAYLRQGKRLEGRARYEPRVPSGLLEGWTGPAWQLIDTRGNDTIAAIVGAAVGARHGLHALPREWRDGLLGRTGAEDDGRYQELVAAAVARWGGGRQPRVRTAIVRINDR